MDEVVRPGDPNHNRQVKPSVLLVQVINGGNKRNIVIEVEVLQRTGQDTWTPIHELHLHDTGPWRTVLGVGFMVRVWAWDPRVLSSNPTLLLN